MENGFTSQFTNSVTPMPRMWWRTSPKAAKSTLSSMGMIMTQMSRPTGRFTRATSQAPMVRAAPGNTCPSPMPTTMHSTTHTVR